MTNNSVWPSPDTQVAQQGRSDVHGVYLLDPVTQKAVTPSTSSVGTALASWSSQPTQTAAAAADTTLKFGAGGTATPTHVALQNNNTISLYYSFDQDSTVSTNQIYVLAAGQLAVWDRSFAVLHCHSASQVAFGGTSGFTVEAFA